MVFIKRNAQPMPTKSLELPLKVAQAFTRDMRAFFKAKTQLEQDEIASRQLHALQAFQRPRDKKFEARGRETDVPRDEGLGLANGRLSRALWLS
jgi:hypothetical protein